MTFEGAVLCYMCLYWGIMGLSTLVIFQNQKPPDPCHQMKPMVNANILDKGRALLSSALLYWSLKTRDPAATLGQFEGRRKKMGKGFMSINYFKGTKCFI